MCATLALTCLKGWLPCTAMAASNTSAIRPISIASAAKRLTTFSLARGLVTNSLRIFILGIASHLAYGFVGIRFSIARPLGSGADEIILQILSEKISWLDNCAIVFPLVAFQLDQDGIDSRDLEAIEGMATSVLAPMEAILLSQRVVKLCLRFSSTANVVLGATLRLFWKVMPP